MNKFPNEVFWPVFEAAGMLCQAERALADGTTDCFLVSYEEPDTERPLTGALSKDYLIEYQVLDAPDLAEGDEVIVTNQRGERVLFQVREAPRVPEGGGVRDGYFRRALLTRSAAEP